MTGIAKLTVTEQQGIRRFLYPMQLDLQIKRPEALELAVRDETGNLLPAEFYWSKNKVTAHFAVSLAPYEKKRLTIFESDKKVPIPDPINSEILDDGRIVNRQEHFATTAVNVTDLMSVVYDGVEHLAAPVIFTLNAEKPHDEVLRSKTCGGELTFHSKARRRYLANARICHTELNLSACKSWAQIVHTIDRPAGGSIVSVEIPLTLPAGGEQPICDFGMGNGSYSKIDGEQVVLEADFYGKKPYCCWQIGRLTDGLERVDYQGDATTPKALSQTLYFHWTLPSRSLAVAVTELPSSCTHFQALIGRDGRIHISTVLGEIPARQARLGLVLHFLNNVPAIAAATNPASILGTPKIAVKR